MRPTLNILYLCTHNSARSILAEALTNHLGAGRFRGFSAGSSPREHGNGSGGPHPLGLQALREAGISTQGLSSKSWDEFAHADAPKMDLVVTVCDNAANEPCPWFAGAPATAHWGYADPSAGDGSDAVKLEAFRGTLQALRERIELLMQLPAEKLQASQLQASARELATS
jgi:arsenate reductase (thioredoxin)